MGDRAESTPRPHVVKVGGSWLADPRGIAALRSWLDRDRDHDHDHAANRPRPRILLAGGGPLVDGLRRLDAANPIDARAAHWAAIDAMDVNARLLAYWLPGASLTESWQRLGGAAPWLWVFAPARFLRTAEPGLPGTRLPVGWSVTSDSIAARVAESLGVGLTLLKAARPAASPTDLNALAAEAYVDRNFATAASKLVAIDFVSLDAFWGGEGANCRS